MNNEKTTLEKLIDTIAEDDEDKEGKDIVTDNKMEIEQEIETENTGKRERTIREIIENKVDKHKEAEKDPNPSKSENMLLLEDELDQAAAAAYDKLNPLSYECFKIKCFSSPFKSSIKKISSKKGKKICKKKAAKKRKNLY